MDGPASPGNSSSWSLGLRLLHGGLSVAVVAALFTPSLPRIHVWAGEAAGSLVALRLALGIAGPRAARLSALAAGPVVPDLAALVRRVPWTGPGLRPANGALALLLLLAVAGTALSGLAALHAPDGPDKGIIIGVPPSFAAEADGPAPAPGLSFRQLHALFAAFTLAALILHIVGVALACWAQRANLFGGIVVGKTRAK